MKSEELITGVIQSDNKPVLFTVPKGKYEFTFLTDTIYNYKGNNMPTHIPANNDFLFGKTHDNRRIAIYVGKNSFELLTSAFLSTGAYIIYNPNMGDDDQLNYDIIEFRGKVLGQLTNIIELKSNPIKYKVETNEYKFELSIHVNDTFNDSEIDNSVILEICFENPQPSIYCFTHYNKIVELISFLAYRKNIYFTHIFLKRNNAELSKLAERNIATNFAEVFVNVIKEESEKNHYDNICFEDIGDSLPNLLRLFYKKKKKKPSYSLGFIPENDNNSHIMTNLRIREICTALECEFSLQTDNINDNDLLNKLIHDAKDFVAEFKNTNPGLSDDTYSLINANIKNWSFTAKEKFCFIFEKYKNDICFLIRCFNTVNEKAISDVIKYRNDITHGSYRIMDLNIARTAYALAALVYCCILTRIGVSQAQIHQLCYDKKMLQ